MAKLIEVAEFRCSNCNHLLLKQAINDGVFEIKCTKCGRIITFNTKCDNIKGIYYAK